LKSPQQAAVYRTRLICAAIGSEAASKTQP
jgi:hypothetical protein